MCRIGTEFFVYVFFADGGGLPLGRAALGLPPLRGAPRNAPYRCHAERHADVTLNLIQGSIGCSSTAVMPDLGGHLLLFVERGSPAERHADENQHRM